MNVNGMEQVRQRSVEELTTELERIDATLALNTKREAEIRAGNKERAIEMASLQNMLREDANPNADSDVRTAIRAKYNTLHTEYNAYARKFQNEVAMIQKQNASLRARRTTLATQLRTDKREIARLVREEKRDTKNDERIQRDEKREQRKEEQKEIKERFAALKVEAKERAVSHRQILNDLSGLPPEQRRDVALKLAQMPVEMRVSYVASLVGSNNNAAASLSLPPMHNNKNKNKSAPGQLPAGSDSIGTSTNTADDSPSSRGSSLNDANSFFPDQERQQQGASLPASLGSCSSSAPSSAKTAAAAAVSSPTSCSASSCSPYDAVEDKIRQRLSKFPRNFIFDQEDIEILNFVASGGGGKVFRVKIRSVDRIVAAKSFLDEEGIDRSIRECEIALKIHHKNIVTTIGLCLMVSSPPPPVPASTGSDDVAARSQYHHHHHHRHHQPPELLLLMELAEGSLANILRNATSASASRSVGLESGGGESSSSEQQQKQRQQKIDDDDDDAVGTTATASTGTSLSTAATVAASGLSGGVVAAAGASSASSGRCGGDHTATTASSTSSSSSTACSSGCAAAAAVTLPFELVWDYALQICEGLAALHSHTPQKILHLDLKPANVLTFSGNRTLALCDFGLSRTSEHTATDMTHQGAGTARFSSPEQLQSNKVSTRCDVYSFGAILYYMISAEGEPFGGCTFFQMATQRLLDRFLPREGCPEALANICRMCIQPNKDERPKNGQEVLKLLQEAAAVVLSAPQTNKNNNSTPAAASAVASLLVQQDVTKSQQGQQQQQQQQQQKSATQVGREEEETQTVHYDVDVTFS